MTALEQILIDVLHDIAKEKAIKREAEAEEEIRKHERYLDSLSGADQDWYLR